MRRTSELPGKPVAPNYGRGTFHKVWYTVGYSGQLFWVLWRSMWLVQVSVLKGPSLTTTCGSTYLQFSGL